MKKKKIVSLMMSAMMFLPVVSGVAACGGNGNTTVISLYNFDGGVGSEWLDAATSAFQTWALENNKSYEEGKTGVSFDIDKAMNLNAATMDTAGYNIYLDEVQTNVRSFYTQGLLTDISDVLTDSLEEFGESGTIEAKIDPTYRYTLTGSDGKYYGLPYYETYPGLTYDIETFVEYDLYIAAPEATNVETVSKYGKEVKFLVGEGKKSCGNDGVCGTADDGLPTSMVELLSLCYRMTTGGRTIKPFQITGMPSNRNYSTYLIEALWTSLAGYDAMRTNYTFDNDALVVVQDGEDNFSAENLFTGIDYIKKPKTETIEVTEANGYRVYDMVERYYATAFLEIIEKEGWFASDATSDSVSNTDAQNNFIFSLSQNNPMGMLIDGSYWYQESERRGFFNDYYTYAQTNDRKLGWMSLPTSLYDSVQEGQPREQALLEMSHSYVTLNKASLQGNSGLEKACKDFLKFMYTNEQLRSFTAITGIPKGRVAYSMAGKESELSTYQKSVWDLRNTCKIVYAGAPNETFYKKQQSLELSANIGLFRPFYNGTQYDSYWSVMRWNTAKVGDGISEEIFEVGRLRASSW